MSKMIEDLKWKIKHSVQLIPNATIRAKRVREYKALLKRLADHVNSK